MPRETTQRIPPEAVRQAGTSTPQLLPHSETWLRVAISTVAITAAAAILLQFGNPNSAWTTVLTAVFFACAAAGQLLTLARRLPLQNVLACAAVIWAPVFIVLSLAYKSPALLGGIKFSPWPGTSVATRIPWQTPLLAVFWIALVLGSRETLRALLRPWRRDRYYGYFLTAGTVLLVLATDLALQPFGVHVLPWWTWPTNVQHYHWQGVPIQCFATSTTLAILVALIVIPWLIPKRPVPTPPDHYPMILWIIVQCFFALSNAGHNQWLAAAVSLVCIAVVLLAALASRSVPAPRPVIA
jgi:hypothetical protein